MTTVEQKEVDGLNRNLKIIINSSVGLCQTKVVNNGVQVTKNLGKKLIIHVFFPMFHLYGINMNYISD
jgi:hypothetical protein